MRILLALSILLLSSMASAQGKYRAGQYPVNQDPTDYTTKVHISATHFRPYCSGLGDQVSCSSAVYVDAILKGKKVELFGSVDKRQSRLIVPGDYFAMLPKKPRAGGSVVLSQQYYVLLPDRTAWFCAITGFSE